MAKKINEPQGKTEESLVYSRKVRSDFLFRMGLQDVPHSILYHDRADLASDVPIAGGRDYGSFSLVHKTKDRRMRKIFKTSNMSCRAGGLSRFPQNIGRMLVKFYCPERGTVYDPFAGHNSRMELVHRTGRNYIGVDVSHEFMESNRKIKDGLTKQKGLLEHMRGTIRLIEGSSASVPGVPDEWADFTITSPPYWNLEYYGNEPEQLGKAKTYKSFLELLYPHVMENYRILKPGSFCIWCINDFVQDKVFYPYHIDISSLFVRAGFNLHNIYVTDLGQPIVASFLHTLIITKRFPKRHEYCVVGQKPGENPEVETHINQLGGLK